MKQRIDWIDAIRGFAIFLVALGHNSIQPAVFGWIYSFHMPLFFFLSGFLFSADKYPTFWSFLTRKIQTLLLPYFGFFTLIYIYWLVVVDKIWLHPGDFLAPILNIFYSSTKLEGIFQPMWFLPCLFLTEILFYTIYKKAKKYYFLAVIPIVLLGYLLSLKFPTLPWSIATAMVVLVFYALGYLVKEIGILPQEVRKNKIILTILAVFFLAINITFFIFNGTVDLLFSHYRNFLLFLLSALGGIGGWLLVFFLLQGRNGWLSEILKFWGKNSLVIFVFHPIGILLAKKIVAAIFVFSSFTYNDQKSVLFGIVYSLIAITIIVPLCLLYNWLSKPKLVPSPKPAQ